MMKYSISHNGVEIPINEPTVEVWMKLTAMQDFVDNKDFALDLISVTTGLSKEEILEHDWFEIMQVSSGLSEYFINQGAKFYDSFELDGQLYKFIDLTNMTFGEFVDIDSFLTKPESVRKNELHYHMALLYREVDKDGNLVKYDASELEQRANKMKKAPIKIVNGALLFFFNIEMELRKHTSGYLSRVLWVKTLTIRMTILRIFLSFGIGILRLWSCLTTISQKFLRFFKSHLRRY
jgi:hypothetical protein